MPFISIVNTRKINPLYRLIRFHINIRTSINVSPGFTSVNNSLLIRNISTQSHCMMTKVDSSASKLPWEVNSRLSPDIKPISYNLFMHPDLLQGTFKGKAEITIKVESPQEYIALHSKGLNITHTSVTNLDNAIAFEIKDFFEYEKNEFWIITGKTPIIPGIYAIHLNYQGSLSNKIIGFYRSSYKDAEKNDRFLATTKFEPTFARQAFPCFDEPSFKAEYEITLVHPIDYIALSNTPQESERVNFPSDNLVTVKFAKTVAMSTYLACFIVCDFDYLDPVMSKKGVPITAYARKEHIKSAQHSQQVAVKALDYYTDYFEVDYPLPKLDLIAIPDFVSGAMENWGLITFRETSMLFNEVSTPSLFKIRISKTVAHEVAHMWFGNLVTMKWWNDLWLNEGYASYMEFKAVSNIFPNWDMDTLFLIFNLHNVLDLDSTTNSHPIVQPVSHPDQITEIFDAISYSKGASVIRMLEHTVGEEGFRKGVSSYLKKYNLNNAETQDLWDNLQLFAPEMNITSFMDTFTRQMGFPLITVTQDGTKFTFTQKRFLKDPTTKHTAYRWEVPITLVTSNDPAKVHRIWLHSNDDNVMIDTIEQPEWVKVNYHQVGYYKVNYDQDNWKKLIALLQYDHNALHPADRSNLISDIFSLADGQVIEYDLALEMTKYLPQEDHYVPWMTIYTLFMDLRLQLYGTSAYKPFAKYMQKVLTKSPYFTWDLPQDLDMFQRSVRVLLIKLGCAFGHEGCLKEAGFRFSKYINDNDTDIHPDISSTIYHYGIQETGIAEWETLFDKMSRETNLHKKLAALHSLSSTKLPELHKRLLDVAQDERFVRSQDYFIMLMEMSSNPLATDLLWDFVRERWDYMVRRFSLNDRAFGRLIPSVTERFSTTERQREMEQFFAAHPEAGAGAAGRKRALEKVTYNIKWRKRFESGLKNWFENATKE